MQNFVMVGVLVGGGGVVEVKDCACPLKAATRKRHSGAESNERGQAAREGSAIGVVGHDFDIEAEKGMKGRGSALAMAHETDAMVPSIEIEGFAVDEVADGGDVLPQALDLGVFIRFVGQVIGHLEPLQGSLATGSGDGLGEHPTNRGERLGDGVAVGIGREAERLDKVAGRIAAAVEEDDGVSGRAGVEGDGIGDGEDSQVGIHC